MALFKAPLPLGEGFGVRAIPFSGGVGRVYLYPGGVRELTAEPAPTIINYQLQNS
ncbi:hypothetical protein ACN4EW_27815 [Arthrospira platensis CENA650]